MNSQVDTTIKNIQSFVVCLIIVDKLCECPNVLCLPTVAVESFILSVFISLSFYAYVSYLAIRNECHVSRNTSRDKGACRCIYQPFNSTCICEERKDLHLQ
ncbi:CLUMA_CG015487, isoform A [Clunio marinus]|uniref:CLUMA_CG015487, isoform A n=1 Tax=Clunio marinus TaxID=568069 RepID=A0A1J1IPF5_9DIPT|nr:CLUMA_CG015487, isoform A [Clunio marinus]